MWKKLPHLYISDKHDIYNDGVNDTKNTAVFSLDPQQTPIKRKEFMGIFISWNIWAANTFYENIRPKVSMEILKNKWPIWPDIGLNMDKRLIQLRI